MVLDYPVGPKANDQCPYKRREREIPRHTEQMGAGIGAMRPQG